MSITKVEVKPKKGGHKGDPIYCPTCIASKVKAMCTYCGHVLTGAFTDDGRTVCEKCGKHIWLGVGNAND